MATPLPDTAARIEAFIRRHFHVIDGDPGFSRDAHLFEGGYVDSAGIVELLMFIESTFGVTFGDDQIFSDQFTTINGISALLAALDCRDGDLRPAVR
ncbi:MAG TPA: acyl carrier protein [Vicinamibacterales bacterium]|nr:acyl carrier protein [Vicinamibacterales bacterium]